MKQTHQAMTFTLAQYRAVFKNAYFKGLSVLVLGSSISGIQSAQAATAAESDSLELNSGKVLSNTLGTALSDALQSAGTETNDGITFDTGSYVISKQEGTASITKDSGDFTLPSGSGGQAVLDNNGTLHLQGKVNLNGVSFDVNADDPVNVGSRIGFDGSQQVEGSEFYNIVSLTGENHIGEQLTLHTKTQLLNGTSGQVSGGSLDVSGYMTVSKGADDSDLSAVDITISPLAQGENAGYGDLTLDPNITVGNLTFKSGSQSTDIDLYYDQSADGTGTGHSGERTITVVDGKAVTFEAGVHNIKSSVKASDLGSAPSTEIVGPSLVFSGSNTSQILNQGTLNVQRPVTITGGIAFNNAGTLVTESGSGAAINADELSQDNRVDRLGNITINSGSTFTNTGKVTIGAGTTFDITANALVNGVINQDAASNNGADTQAEVNEKELFKFVDLKQALGDFTNSGNLVLRSDNSKDTDYVFLSTVNDLKQLGVDFSATNVLAEEGGVEAGEAGEAGGAGAGSANQPLMVLDNTSLQVTDNLNLSSSQLGNLSGSKSNTSGSVPQLQTTGKLNFTTQKMAEAEDLRGLGLAAQQLNFISGKQDNSDASSILISGSAASEGSAPVVFTAAQSVTSQNNRELQFTNASLHLQNFADPNNAMTGTEGKVQVNLSFAGSGSELVVKDRLWTAQDIKLTDNAVLKLDGSSTNSSSVDSSSTNSTLSNVGLYAQNITLDADSSMQLSGGSLSVKSLNSSGSVTGNNVDLDIRGNGQITSWEFLTNGASNFTLTDSTINLNDAADTINLKYTATAPNGDSRKAFTVEDSRKFTAKNTTIKLNLDGISGIGSLTVEEANGLLSALTTDSSTGFISLTGKTAPKLPVTTDPDTKEQIVDYETLAKGGTLVLNFDTEESRNARLTNVSGSITGGWKGVETKSGNASIGDAGTLALYGPDNGQFAQDANGKIVGINAGSGSTLNFNGTGKVGAITGTTATVNVVSGAQVDVVDSSGVAQAINVDMLKNHGQLTAAAVTANQLDLTAQSSLQATSLNLAQTLTAQNAKIKLSGDAKLGTTANFTASSLEAQNVTGEALSLTQGSLIKIANTLTANNIALTGGSELQALNINLGQNGELRIGTESTSANDTVKTAGVDLLADAGSTGSDNNGSTGSGNTGSDNNSSTGTGTGNTGSTGNGSTTPSTQGTAHVVAGNINLNGGRLVLDPDFKQATATLFAQSIGGTALSVNGNGQGSTKAASSVMKVDGDIVIGRNSALGLSDDGSTTSQLAFEQALARHQVNGALTSTGIGAYLYVDRTGIDLNGHKLIMGTDDVTKLEAQLDSASSADIYLGSGSGLQVTAKALNAAGSGTVFVNLGSDKTLESKGGQIIVPANISSEDFTKIFGKQIDFADNSTLTVTTENGLYSATITTDDALHGNFEMLLSSDARQILSDLSTPTYDYIMELYSNNTKFYDNQQAFDQALAQQEAGGTSAYGANGIAVVKNSIGYQFIQDISSANDSRSLEQAGRLAIFGGGMQAALMAADSTTNAINSRLGFGAGQINGTVMPGYAEGSLWATPIYKYQSSDGLEADNIGYGADVNLYGAALGLDGAFSNGLRVGGMLNIGQGDADGNGIGSGVSNDFDYYGFGVYLGFAPQRNVQLTADASYTVVDNDVQSAVGIKDYNKLTASSNTKAFSLGVGAQATFKGAMDITPHGALRYTHLAMDDYAVKVDGEVLAHTDAKSADIFSLPVGVTFSQELRDGAWIFKPFADVTLTANFGDTDISSTNNFEGIYGAKLQYNSELMENFTYGASAGLDVQNGNFRFGFKAGYTGSSSVDDYTVSADVRLIFQFPSRLRKKFLQALAT